MNECAACARGIARVRNVQRSDKRLTKPLKLVGDKGSGRVRGDYLGRGLRPHSGEARSTPLRPMADPSRSCYAGRFGQLQRPDTARSPALSSRWLGGGTSRRSGKTLLRRHRTRVCAHDSTASACSWTRNEIANSNYIIAWGNNPAITIAGLLPAVSREMVDNGGTLVRDRSYSTPSRPPRSQEWIAALARHRLRPLGLAMLKTVVDEELYDEEFLHGPHHAPPAWWTRRRERRCWQIPRIRHHLSWCYDTATRRCGAPTMPPASRPLLTVEGTPEAAQYNYVTVSSSSTPRPHPWDSRGRRGRVRRAPTTTSPRIARDYANAEHAMIVQQHGRLPAHRERRLRYRHPGLPGPVHRQHRP